MHGYGCAPGPTHGHRRYEDKDKSGIGVGLSKNIVRDIAISLAAIKKKVEITLLLFIQVVQTGGACRTNQSE